MIGPNEDGYQSHHVTMRHTDYNIEHTQYDPAAFLRLNEHQAIVMARMLTRTARMLAEAEFRLWCAENGRPIPDEIADSWVESR